jgi:hypothetical protein
MTIIRNLVGPYNIAIRQVSPLVANNLKNLFYPSASRQTHISNYIGSSRVIIIFGLFRIAKIFVTCCSI